MELLSKLGRSTVWASVGLAILTCGSHSQAGYTHVGADGSGPEIGRPIPPAAAPGSLDEQILNRIRAAVAVLRQVGHGPDADLVEEKLSKGLLNIELVPAEKVTARTQKSSCGININQSWFLSAAIDQVAGMFVHELSHGIHSGISPSDFEHCLAYWEEFKYLKARLMQYGDGTVAEPPFGNPESAEHKEWTANLLSVGNKMDQIKEHYPAFDDHVFTDPEDDPSLPPGNPKHTDEDRMEKITQVALDSESPALVLTYRSTSSGEVHTAAVSGDNGTVTQGVVSTGLEGLVAMETVFTVGNEHYLLCAGNDVVTADPRVVVLIDTNADLVVDTVVPLAVAGPPLASVTSVGVVHQLGGGQKAFVLDAVAAQVRNTEDTNADGVPDVVTTVFADGTLSPPSTRTTSVRTCIEHCRGSDEATTRAARAT